jgi:poly-gamma-glutamate synthesis protein (capsule biosynthesis protein)
LSELNLLFCGDYVPARRYEPMIIEKGKEIFGDLQEDIAQADVAFLNLEAPLTRRGAPIRKAGKKAGPNLRAAPACFDAVSGAGFDVVSLANNHMMDQGVEGLEDSLGVCRDAGILTCGAGQNIGDARKPAFLSQQGVVIAIIAVAERQFGIAGEDEPGVAPLDAIDNFRQVQQAKTQADLVFVSVHGGNELYSWPRPGLRKLCHFLIESGADAVICHHSHVPGAYELIDGKPIFYSLGNLIFDHVTPPEGWTSGYAVSLNYRDNALQGFELIPFEQTLAAGGLKKLSGASKDRFMQKLEGINKVLHDTNAFNSEWQSFCDLKEPQYIFEQYSPVLSKTVRWLNQHTPLKQSLLTKSTLNIKTNMLRCESHYELLMTVLEKKSKAFQAEE